MNKYRHTFFLIVLFISISVVSYARNKPKVYVLSIGISKYQHANLNLGCPKNDADIFYQMWNNSEIRAEYDVDFVNFLRDETATEENIHTDLNNLKEIVTEGDLVYIYFAGHGDVDVQSATKEAYLLTYNSPSKNANYSGFALRMTDLNMDIATICKKKATVVLIIDACHAGKALVVTDSIFLNKQINSLVGNEIRILACNADEKSIEDKSLDGGRGIFSYYLTSGLQGLADANQNNKIELSEIKTYLTKNVSNYARKLGYMQNPVVSSKITTPFVICPVNLNFIKNHLPEYTRARIDDNSQIVLRGVFANLTNGLNATDSLKLIRFMNSINFKAISMVDERIGPLKNYTDLQSVNLSKSIRDYVNDSYIAALQFKGDFILSNQMETDTFQSTIEELDIVIREFEKSLTLLKEKGRETNICQAKIYYFKSMQLKLNKQFKTSPDLQKKSFEFAKLAFETNKKFVYYVFNLAWLYKIIGDYPNAIQKYNECIALKPKFDKAYMNMAICYEMLGKKYSAEAFDAYSKAIEISPSFKAAIDNLRLFGTANPTYRAKIDKVLSSLQF
ncbi:MAG: caspase family protein [Bacteroidetes bacterium]|nr:caspase family protein [Bacteroidota bacterium]